MVALPLRRVMKCLILEEGEAFKERGRRKKLEGSLGTKMTGGRQEIKASQILSS
jgi:hypothetical protein